MPQAAPAALSPSPPPSPRGSPRTGASSHRRAAAGAPGPAALYGRHHPPSPGAPCSHHPRAPGPALGPGAPGPRLLRPSTPFQATAHRARPGPPPRAPFAPSPVAPGFAGPCIRLLRTGPCLRPARALPAALPGAPGPASPPPSTYLDSTYLLPQAPGPARRLFPVHRSRRPPVRRPCPAQPGPAAATAPRTYRRRVPGARGPLGACPGPARRSARSHGAAAGPAGLGVRPGAAPAPASARPQPRLMAPPRPPTRWNRPRRASPPPPRAAPMGAPAPLPPYCAQERRRQKSRGAVLRP